MSDQILFDSDGFPYEDLITLEPISVKNAYCLDGRYYDINSLQSYVNSNTDSVHVVPHTRAVLTINQKNDIINAHNAIIIHKNIHQRHHVKIFDKGFTQSGVEYIKFRHNIPIGTIIYDKNQFGTINKYTTIIPYFENNLTCFVMTREKTVKASDVIGYSLPSDQIGTV